MFRIVTAKVTVASGVFSGMVLYLTHNQGTTNVP